MPTGRVRSCVAVGGVKVLPAINKHRYAIHRLGVPRESMKAIHRHNEYLAQGYHDQPGRLPTPYSVAEQEKIRQSVVTKFALDGADHLAREGGLFEEQERQLIRDKLEHEFWDNTDSTIINEDNLHQAKKEARGIVLELRKMVDHAEENLNKVLNGVMRDSKWLVFIKGLHCDDAKDFVYSQLKANAVAFHDVEWLADDKNCYDLYVELSAKKELETVLYRARKQHISDITWIGRENCHALQHICRYLNDARILTESTNLQVSRSGKVWQWEGAHGDCDWPAEAPTESYRTGGSFSGNPFFIGSAQVQRGCKRICRRVWIQ